MCRTLITATAANPWPLGERLLERMRVVEVGELCLLKRVIPQRTEFYFTGTVPRRLNDIDYHVLTAERAMSLWRLLRSGDVDLVVVPPPQMGNYLRAGLLSGYCVGEPWNTYAVSEGLGRTLVTSYDIWNNHPEKVFGVTRAWADANPNTHLAAVRALIQACQWLDDRNHRAEAAEILSQGRYVNAPVDVIEKSLAGRLQYSSDQEVRKVEDFNVFHRYLANFPWRSHAVWFLTQMVRWGHAPESVGFENVTRAVYRPGVYREAARALGLPVSADDCKVEGGHSTSWELGAVTENVSMGPDQFMDGRVFDPHRPHDYVASFAELPPVAEEPVVVPQVSNA